jgi:hypothetical protein
VWSRGRLIGNTDLGFCSILDGYRSGWFQPNELGERLMPLVASPLPAVRAFLHRHGDAEGTPIVRPELIGSTLFADLAESFQHLTSFELSLRDSDGALIPTADIGFQDAERLQRLGQQMMDDIDADGGVYDERFELEESMLELDADALDDRDYGEPAWDDLASDLASDLHSEWSPDAHEMPEHERYQIHLRLA